MKFTDGRWMMRKGVHAAYPAQVLDVRTGQESLTIYAPGYPVTDRVDLQRGPVFTVELTAPMPNVIGVSVTHFAGEMVRPPRFELADDGTAEAPVVSHVDGAVVLSSGALSVRVRRDAGWGLEFLAEGRRTWPSSPRTPVRTTCASG
jgi:alpha-D-xyloside xylohydrolase